MDLRKALLYLTLMLSALIAAYLARDGYYAYRAERPWTMFAAGFALAVTHVGFTVWRILRKDNR